MFPIVDQGDDPGMSQPATTLYIPHGGGPLPLLDERGYAPMNAFLRGFGATRPRPDAIVVFSAHWEAEPIAITAAARPRLLFDYRGFPPESYAYRYPAPGAPALAGRIRELLAGAGIAATADAGRGLDHGVFIPLLLMYPDADIPCLQVSLSPDLDAARHIRIGAALAPLTGDNLLLLGSGFSFHNMRALMSKRDDAPDRQNLAFEDWLRQTCCATGIDEGERARRLAGWENAPHARYCHPREEHLLPLMMCYGAAGAAAERVFFDQVAGFRASAYRWG